MSGMAGRFAGLELGRWAGLGWAAHRCGAHWVCEQLGDGLGCFAVVVLQWYINARGAALGELLYVA